MVEFFFEDVKILKENVLGDFYKGFKYMMFGFVEECFVGVVVFMGCVECVFEVMMDYIIECKVFGKFIGMF